MKTLDELRRTVAISYSFKSNSDDFGIFLQAVLTTIVLIFGPDVKKIKVKELMRIEDEDEITDELLRLYSMYIASKRGTEIERIHSTDPAEMVRGMIVSEVAGIFEKHAKGESS